MEIRDIEYFSAVAEHLHVGRAAEALGMSQSALSKCLRRIENAVGAKIVKRTPKGVELTGTGSAVLSHIHRLRTAHADIMREVADLSQGSAGHLRIGVSQGLPEQLLGAASGLLLNERQKVTLEVVVVKTDELMAALSKGKFDLAVSSAETALPSDLEQLHLLDDQFAVYASVEHPLASRKRVPLSDLTRERWTKSAANRFSWDVLSRIFQANRLPPPVLALEANSAVIRFHAMAASGLLHFSSRPFIRRAATGFCVTELNVTGLAWTRHIHVIYRKGGYLSPVARRLIELLKMTANKISKDS